MSRFEQVELELNKWKTPMGFHDMFIVNIQFLNDTIRIIFALAKYMDEYNILEDDDHYALLEVIYSGVKIKKMNLEGIMDFRDASVYLLDEDDNGVINLNVSKDEYNQYFYIEFTCKKYHWTVRDIVSVDDYDNYLDILSNKNEDNDNSKMPKWSIF